MNVLYTQFDFTGFDSVAIETVSRDEPELSGLSINYMNGDVATTVFIDAQTIFRATGESSFKDCSTYYVVFENGGFSVINKFAETFYTKQSGIEYIRAINKVVPVQIYIPFASNSLEGATVRVCGPGVPTLDGVPLDSSLEVPATQEAFTDLMWKLVPKVSAPAESSSPVRAQLMLDGQPLQKAGVSIVAKTSDGLVTTSVQTDENGIAEFVASPGSTVEFGFRYYSNMASTTVL